MLLNGCNSRASIVYACAVIAAVSLHGPLQYVLFGLSACRCRQSQHKGIRLFLFVHFKLVLKFGLLGFIDDSNFAFRFFVTRKLNEIKDTFCV